MDGAFPWIILKICESSISHIKTEFPRQCFGFIAKSIVIEAAELLECFQWEENSFDMEHVKEELADVIIYSQNLLDKLELDVDEIVNKKLDINEEKYPVEKAKGNAAKYDQLT